MSSSGTSRGVKAEASSALQGAAGSLGEQRGCVQTSSPSMCCILATGKPSSVPHPGGILWWHPLALPCADTPCLALVGKEGALFRGAKLRCRAGISSPAHPTLWITARVNSRDRRGDQRQEKQLVLGSSSPYSTHSAANKADFIYQSAPWQILLIKEMRFYVFMRFGLGFLFVGF